VISRRTFVATVTGGLLAAPLAAGAQLAAKMYRIGLLSTLPPGSSGVARLWEPFVQGLRELGYVEGENLVIERRYAPEGQPGQLPELAADLVRLKVDVIVAGGSLTPHAARSATTTVPVIFTNHGDPLGSGLVVSLARPGGNSTGLSLLSLELVGKQLDLLKKAVPRSVRVAILWNPTSRTHPRMLNEAEAAARALGLRLERLSASGLDDYDRAFEAMTRARADTLLVLGDPIFWYQRSRIVEMATKRRLPGMFGQREYVEAGGLMSYGPDLRDNFRRAATYVDKILKGAKPGDLPIEQPTKFELVINSKTAKVLGLTMPQSVLVQADQIIE
jgi:putative ABC transport system substrate-binding protein